MDWSRGYSASYYLSVVDPDTWLDNGERIEIISGSIRRTISDLLESASIKTTDYFINREEWVRVYMTAKQSKQSNGSDRVALFTGLASAPSRDFNGRLETNTLSCYSVLAPADDVLLPRGWYAPYDADAVLLVKDLLKTTKAPVDIDETDPPYLKQAIIAEGGETHLTMVNKILQSINWRIKIGGDGVIHIAPPAESESLVIDTLNYDIAEPSITVERDWHDCPNVFRAVMNGSFAIARDEDEDSPYSIQNRGREIWVEEQNQVLNDKETLSEYAERRLKELQQVETIVTYDRRYVPEVLPTDVVRLNFAAQGVTGTFLITSQTVDLGGSPKTSEEVRRV